MLSDGTLYGRLEDESWECWAAIAFVNLGRVRRRHSSDAELLIAYGLATFLMGLAIVFALGEAF